MVALPHVEEQAAGDAAAVKRHGQPDSRHLLRLHRLAQREEHTEFGLHGVETFRLPHGLLPGHRQIFAQRHRAAGHRGQLSQQRLRDGLGLCLAAAQNEQFDLCGLQHFAVGGGQGLRRQAVHLFQIALLPDACRAGSEELPVGLPLAVDALFVHFIFQRFAEHLLLDGHGLRVEHAARKGGVKGRAQRQCGVFAGEVLPFQCKAVLDASGADAEVVVRTQRAGVHGQVCAVQTGQLFGHLGHIGAVRIAALHHQREQRVGGGRLTLCRESEMEADAAAVEFWRRVPRKMDAGRDLGSFQWFLLWIYDFARSSARNSSSARPDSRMAQAFSTPTYRQCQGA